MPPRRLVNGGFHEGNIGIGGGFFIASNRVYIILFTWNRAGFIDSIKVLEIVFCYSCVRSPLKA